MALSGRRRSVVDVIVQHLALLHLVFLAHLVDTSYNTWRDARDEHEPGPGAVVVQVHRAQGEVAHLGSGVEGRDSRREREGNRRVAARDGHEYVV